MRPTSRLVGRLPKSLQTGVRWYAASFLNLFVIVCAAVWPMFAVSLQ